MFDIIMTLLAFVFFLAIAFVCGVIFGKMKEGDRWEDLLMAYCTLGYGGFDNAVKRTGWVLLNVVIDLIWLHFFDTPVFIAFCLVITFTAYFTAMLLNSKGIEYSDSNTLMRMFTK